MGFEESLIRNAAPTLAGIKVASLYNYHFNGIKECELTLDSINQRLNGKGIYIELMNHDGDFYLIYVYRKKQLYELLCDKDVRSFLNEYGYCEGADMDITGQVRLLRERINVGSSFPHEIGVFLGYPLPDVKEFIDRKGEGCIICGEWKVYHNEQSAMCFFCKLKKCREVYLRTYIGGKDLYGMTVSI